MRLGDLPKRRSRTNDVGNTRYNNHNDLADISSINNIGDITDACYCGCGRRQVRPCGRDAGLHEPSARRRPRQVRLLC